MIPGATEVPSECCIDPNATAEDSYCSRYQRDFQLDTEDVISDCFIPPSVAAEPMLSMAQMLYGEPFVYAALSCGWFRKSLIQPIRFSRFVFAPALDMLKRASDVSL